MRMFKFFGLALIASAALVSCVGDDDTELPNYTPLILGQDFENGAADNTILDVTGWSNFVTAGAMRWKNQTYSGNNYAEFTGYQSGDATNIGWLISPAVNLDEQEGESLKFDVSQSYVTDASNSLEVLISTDWDGTEANINAATWTALPASIPGTSATYFEFQDSGNIDLSTYTGTAHIAFKVTGGTAAAIDGGYQIDNVKISYQN
ncbi:choice-of-anchor J domain-containing protein [Flavobacterium sp.]|uniref:choice-of-anchor J domain-containing protein n=1 Tax=Flavobacterium sp. TaxID=239 RepID=UPI00121788B0|nr:choice-of-anchor J domain-containing protein [Flavobacterium sp.]RZJ72385.1 MAG: DUF5017 domain-containing protein [Flavobacterium sp.]